MRPQPRRRRARLRDTLHFPAKTVQLNVILLAGVTDTVDRDVTRANAALAPAGITLVASKSTLSPADSRAILGDDNVLQVNPAADDHSATELTPEEATLFRRSDHGRINVFYVPRVAGRDDDS